MSETSWYVQRGKVLIGAFPSYAAAGRESNTEAGGVVTDHVEAGCTVIPLDQLTTWKELSKQVEVQSLTSNPDGLLDADLTPVDSLSDEWEDLQSAGLTASEGQEIRRWYLGDLAAKVERRYGKKSLKKFATEIKIPKSSTLRDYERVSKFYLEFDARARFPSLSWSHYREAIKSGEFEDAMDWLVKAVDNNWSVVDLGQAIDKTKGKTVKVNHKYEAIPVSYAQGRITLGTTDLDVKDYLERVTEGRSREDFAVTIVVSWLEHEAPIAA